MMGKLGSGKGTQAEILSQRFNIPAISVGNLYRQEIINNTEIGKTAKRIFNGEFMPDDITNSLVLKRIENIDCANGFIIDGYPRTTNQANCIINYIDLAIDLDISDELCFERLLGRRIHKASGRTYHIKYKKPIIENIDDITGEMLEIRSDDRKEVIENRLKIYYQESECLFRYYKEVGFPVLKIDSSSGVQTVADLIYNQIQGVNHGSAKH